jgi:membrane protein DedA with SNARE-associated domain
MTGLTLSGFGVILIIATILISTGFILGYYAGHRIGHNVGKKLGFKQGKSKASKFQMTRSHVD